MLKVVMASEMFVENSELETILEFLKCTGIKEEHIETLLKNRQVTFEEPHSKTFIEIIDAS
jgi:hypothetical protein